MRNDQADLGQLDKKTSLFEILTSRLYELVCEKGDVCVDAGGSYGDHSSGMLRMVGPTGTVHVIEAIPYLADRLKSIALKNELPLIVHNFALSDRLGRSRFQHVKNFTGASGLWHREHLDPSVDIETIDVELTRVDILLSGRLPSWRFFKLDIECGEFHAIRGAIDSIKQHSPFITFENGFGQTAAIAGYTKSEWFDLFDGIGYRPYDLYGYEIDHSRWPDHAQPYNSIAVPKGSKDEAFVTDIWRNEVDRVVADVRDGKKSWPPAAFETVRI